MTSASFNLYQALREAFPSDLDSTALQTDSGLFYTWRDVDAGSAKLANFLQSLDLPPGARIAVQVDTSVESLMLYLASLRAGLVYVPLNMAYQSAEMAHIIRDAAPAVVVCSASQFGWVSKLAFQSGTAWVFTLNDDRTGSLLERAAHASDQHTPAANQADDPALIIYTSGHAKGAMLTHGNLLSNVVVLPVPGVRLAAAQILTHFQASLALAK
jgi:malonyl-CoA/methylmalonyl-CoA synthetase